MAPRNYNLETRRRKQAELRSRMAAAAAKLHATQGIAQTSYADIARQAGVSLPTVHSHFPSEDELFQACTTHAAEQVPLDDIMGAASLSDALGKLVAAVDRQHRYYEPWFAQRMEGYVPFLARLSEQQRERQTALIASLLRHFPGARRRRKTVAACETLLSFDNWNRLHRGHGLSGAEVRRITIQGLLAFVGDETTSPSIDEKTRKSS